ncbi:amidase [Azoarcus taiwanensis]|uniref:Amidase n=1 Tax=Azoarcus taiwanensis TaxID=666964 RepID=A0A972J8G5_9RHOO|nr:amidase [Azoarcus taiwanensis]NMG01645.1 amidase [Azoarcus taiwanensis]
MALEIPAEDRVDVQSAVARLSSVVASAATRLRAVDVCEPFAEVLLATRRQPMPAVTGAQVAPASISSGSALDAVSESFARIAAGRTTPSAWMSLDRNEALARAVKLDEDRSTGAAVGVLHGVPVGLKDMFDRRGRVSSWGSTVRRDEAPAGMDATIVSRLEQAGAVVIGALHMAEFAMSPTGLNDQLGHGTNPHDPQRVSGGSSSGAGMVVGAREVPLAIGSDTGGSVRLPAALCGVTGLKPTQFRLSVAGAMPLSPSLDCIGPLGLSADLCGRALAAMAGADPSDASCVHLPVRAGGWLGRKAGDFSVAVPRLVSGEYLSSEMLASLKRVRGELAEVGMRFVEVDLPDLGLYGDLASVLLAVESAAVHRHDLAKRPEVFGRQVRRRLSRGLLVTGLDYHESQRLRAPLLRRFMRETLEGIDALLLPTTPAGAPRIKDTVGDDHLKLEREFGKLSYWTRGINYLGLPALSLPAGVDSDGLPLSVQFVGGAFDEERLLAIGHIFQSISDWHLHSPPKS